MRNLSVVIGLLSFVLLVGTLVSCASFEMLPGIILVTCVIGILAYYGSDAINGNRVERVYVFAAIAVGVSIALIKVCA